MKIEKRFGLSVKYYRKRLGLSQEQFAERAEIHRTYVSDIELGKVSVSIGIAEKIAKALKISLSRLLGTN